MTPEQRRQLDETITALSEEWNPEHEDLDEVAKKVLRKGLVPSIQSIVDVAMHSSDEKQRMIAARYVVDRNLGPLTSANPLTRAEDPLEALFRKSSSSPLKGS